MGAFFMVLIALAGWCIYKVCSSASDASMEKDRKDYSGNMNIWLNAVTDEALERQLEDYIYRPENRDAVVAQVFEAYHEAPNDPKHMPELFFSVETMPRGMRMTKKEREAFVENSRQIALRILMAKHGKLSRIDAKYGVQNNGFSAPTELQGREWNMFWLNQVLWVTDRLSEHGVETDVFIRSGDGIHTVESCPWRNGTYIWGPMIAPWDKMFDYEEPAS